MRPQTPHDRYLEKREKGWVTPPPAKATDLEYDPLRDPCLEGYYTDEKKVQFIEKMIALEKMEKLGRADKHKVCLRYLSCINMDVWVH